MKTKYTVGSAGALVSVSKKTLPVVVRELKRIESSNGVITPALVVQEAKSARSPLHRFFTWNNDEAAMKFREWQARAMISCVQVTFTGESGEEQITRAFVNVRPDEAEEGDEISEGGYISVAKAARNPGYKGQVVQYAYNQIVNWKRRFGAFKEFSEITAAIDKTKIK